MCVPVLSTIKKVSYIFIFSDSYILGEYICVCDARYVCARCCKKVLQRLFRGLTGHSEYV